ncbi:M20/M25/M40 family metallo-hydrolase [Acidobacteriota bacterium]
MFKPRYQVIVFVLSVNLILAACEKESHILKETVSPPFQSEYSLAEIGYIKSLVERISEEDIKSILVELENFGTRYSPSQGNLKAAHYIKGMFLSFGLQDVSIEKFSYFNELSDLYEETQNVVASKEGGTTPEKIVILGGHFDTITRRAEDGKTSELNKENPAPGTDDNGTGVAAILTAARILSPYDFDCTLRFVAFSAEEQGLFGSVHYAAECARKNEDIIAMINVDMIGHQDQEPEDMDIFANHDSAWLLDLLVSNIPIFAPGLLAYRIVDDSYDGSDHGPFWNNGYSAVCFMEDYYPSNIFYHTPKDTIDTVDLAFTLKSVKLVTGTVAELAGINMDGEENHANYLTKEDLRSKDVVWERDAEKEFLITLMPANSRVDIVDLTFSYAHTKQSLIMEKIPPGRYAVPHYRSVCLCPKPDDTLVFVPMIKMAHKAGDTEEGIVKIFDLLNTAEERSFKVGKYPRQGCFNADGTKFFLPYWGEKFFDIFDSSSFERIGRIASPKPIAKLQVNESGELAVGISPETDSLLIFDLENNSHVLITDEISSPQDIVLLDNRFAIVSSQDEGKIFLVDLIKKQIVAEITDDFPSMKLVVSPDRNTVVAVHKMSSSVSIFTVDREESLTQVKKARTLDFQERIEDAAFGKDSDHLYVISSGKYRLFGFDLMTDEVFWSMRTGGVRARAGFKQILFIAR